MPRTPQHDRPRRGPRLLTRMLGRVPGAGCPTASMLSPVMPVFLAGGVVVGLVLGLWGSMVLTGVVMMQLITVAPRLWQGLRMHRPLSWERCGCSHCVADHRWSWELDDLDEAELLESLSRRAGPWRRPRGSGTYLVELACAETGECRTTRPRDWGHALVHALGGRTLHCDAGEAAALERLAGPGSCTTSGPLDADVAVLAGRLRASLGIDDAIRAARAAVER